MLINPWPKPFQTHGLIYIQTCICTSIDKCLLLLPRVSCNQYQRPTTHHGLQGILKTLLSLPGTSGTLPVGNASLDGLALFVRQHRGVWIAPACRGTGHDQLTRIDVLCMSISWPGGGRYQDGTHEFKTYMGGQQCIDSQAVLVAGCWLTLNSAKHSWIALIRMAMLQAQGGEGLTCM